VSVPDTPLLRFTTLTEWLVWQEKLHFTAIDLGLDRCRTVAEALGILPPAYFVISIAGTNGKGSCAAMLESILRAAGYQVGLYTSPHLLCYNERICINGKQAEDEDLCQAFDRIDRFRGDVSLTYFEFGTLAAMELFQNTNIEIAIMEVGLGGRLDAVNILDADIALISTIDIDHERWLGHDRDSIGREKSGIFRPMRPAVCADPDPPPGVAETANLAGANLLRSGHEFIHETSADGWLWRSGLIQYNGLPIPGNHSWQIQNASGVLMVLQAISDHFPVDEKTVSECLRNFRIPGRFQLIPGKVPVILDVAHNRQAAATLAGNLKTLRVTGRILMVVGMLNDKNHAAFIRELLPCVDIWYVATLEGPRGAQAGELASLLEAAGEKKEIHQFSSLQAALASAQEDALPGDQVVVTGSFVTVGHAMQQLGAGG